MIELDHLHSVCILLSKWRIFTALKSLQHPSVNIQPQAALSSIKKVFSRVFLGPRRRQQRDKSTDLLVHGTEAGHVRVRQRDAVRGGDDGAAPPRDGVPGIQPRQPHAVAAGQPRLCLDLCCPQLLPRLSMKHSNMDGRARDCICWPWKLHTYMCLSLRCPQLCRTRQNSLDRPASDRPEAS